MNKIDRIINKFEEYMVGIIILASSVLIFINVVLRYGFNSGFHWSDEMVRYLMILLTFIGGSICVRTGTHIGVDVVFTVLNEKITKVLLGFIYIVGLIFSLVIAYFGIRIVQRNILHPQLSPALQIPMFIPYLSIVIGFGLSAYRYVQLIYNTVHQMKNVKEG